MKHIFSNKKVKVTKGLFKGEVGIAHWNREMEMYKLHQKDINFGCFDESELRLIK